MVQKVPPNGKNGTIGWNYLNQVVKYADSLPGINRNITVEHRVGFDAIFQEYFLDGTLMQGRYADGLVLHPVELGLPDAEDYLILDVLGLGIGKLVEQFTHTISIKHRLVAQILLTLGRIAYKSRIEHLDGSLVGRKETDGLMAQARISLRTLRPEAMHEVERSILLKSI